MDAAGLQQQKLNKKLNEIRLRKEKQKKRKQASLEKRRRLQHRKCLLGLKSLRRAPFVCFLQMMLLVFGFFGICYLLMGQNTDDISNLFGEFGFYLAFAVFVILFSICIVRAVEGTSTRKRLKGERLSLKKMPKDPTPVIQEAYMGVYCRKCVHYWVSLALGSFAFIAFVYVLIIAGGDKLIQESTGQPTMAIFKADTYNELTSNPADVFTEFSKFKECFLKDWTMQLCFWSLVIIILDLIQYFAFNAGNNGKISAFEEAYGRDKLVNDCLMCYRLNKVNKRYKIVTFSFVCFFGCIIYIFFKRAICVVFDKSFGL